MLCISRSKHIAAHISGHTSTQCAWHVSQKRLVVTSSWHAESLYHQRLAVDTVEISPKELWRLNRQQQAAQAAAAQHGGAGGCRALCGRSVLGMPLLQER
jgi:hypothetical protein